MKISILFIFCSIVQAQILVDLQMNAGSGSVAVDSSGNGNDCTFAVNAPTWASPRGLTFNGAVNASPQYCTILSGDSATTDWWSSTKTIYVALSPNVSNIATNVSNSGPTVLGVKTAAEDLYSYSPYISLMLFGGGGVTNPTDNYKIIGTRVFALVFNSGTCKMYLDGNPVSGYITNTVSSACNSGLLGGSVYIGRNHVGSVMGFIGTMYRFIARNDARNDSQVLSDSQAIITDLTNTGITVGDATPNVAQAIFDGDSRMANWSASDTHGYSDSIEFYTAALLPFTINTTNQAVPLYTYANINGRPGNPTKSIWSTFSTQPAIYSVLCGTNDMNPAVGNKSAATTYSDMQTDVQDKYNAGAAVVVYTEISSSNSTFASRVATYNSTVRSGWANGTLVTPNSNHLAIADIGNDPNFGIPGAQTNTCLASEVHPNHQCRAVWGIYNANAVMKALGSSVSICSVFTVGVNSTNWTLNANSNGSFQGATIAATTIQAIPIFYLGPGYYLTSVQIHVTIPFSASGLTSGTANIGDSIGGNTYFTSGNTDLRTTSDTGRISTLNTTGNTINFVVTGNQNWSTSTLTGSADVTLCIAGSLGNAALSGNINVSGSSNIH